MIIFKKIVFRNFLSAGNSPIEIELNRARTTQIMGVSGSGKSTILDSITFALFGKPFRNINKPNLCNSINGKNCRVDFDFSVDQHEYKIIRGLKPNIFQIFKDGEMINQDAASRDYQKVLEQQILRMNYKVFCQVVILGSASFTPFMQLPSAQRREVIEDILDIRVFSSMNQLLKSKIQSTKEELIRIDEAIQLTKVKVDAQKKLIRTIEAVKTDSIERLELRIEEILKEITVAEESQDQLKVELASLVESKNEENSVKKRLRDLVEKRLSVERKIKDLESRIDFMQDHAECPNCLQPISGQYKVQRISETMEETTVHWKEWNTLEEEVNEVNKEIEKFVVIGDEITEKNLELSRMTNSVTMLNRQIAKLNKEIQDSKHDTKSTDEEQAHLKELANTAVEMLEKKSTLTEQKRLHDIASLLLKDTGIKTAIIREYLPVMNKLINHYLQALDLFIQFELDENFSEVIKSRHRDEFSYNSFSEGEKARINLSILFAWREIARMKNSVNTNLLFMDETLDNSLDDASLECVMGLLESLREGTNLFVVSHRNTNSDRFHSLIRVEKRNDFSCII